MIWQEVRASARGVIRRPAFSLAAAAVFSIAIGATTTVFALAHAWLVRGLPFPDASALVVIDTTVGATIARELVDAVKRNVSIDWTMKESVRAKLRVLVKRVLRKYGYPPDKQERATQTVMEQAELLADMWAA
jgi:hypothetical protein